ncbi:MAG: acetylornithine/succinylornithine family transaminase [Blastocatellales bacterium]
MSERLFVYGTLRRGASAPPAVRRLMERAVHVGRGSVRGKLYDLGWYPGLQLDSEGRSAVVGDIFEIPDEPAFLAALDDYEGCDPGDPSGSLFVRTGCRVEGEGGEIFDCLVYVYNGPVTGRDPVPGGDFLMQETVGQEIESEEMTLERAQELESRYVLQTYARSPVMFVRGKGSVLYDDKGKSYLDFISGIGVSVLGYDHPRVRKVLREQGSLLHTSNLYYHPYQGQLAERLVRASGLSRVFFSNTGTESVEGALKLARAYQRRQGHENKTEFVSLINSFHGRTFGALSITAQEKYRKPFEPLVPGARFLDPNDCDGDFAAAREAINERTAAVIIETIQGEGGVRPINDYFLKVVREACDATGALLILDEVQCGLGRTGRTFAYENTSVVPDVLCVAKPLGLGIPLGAFIVGEKAADGLQPGDHGSTFGGGPLACRMSVEFMEMLQDENLQQRVIDVGNFFRKKLRRLQRTQPGLIVEVRGMGLMVGVELAFPGKPVVAKMLERGYLINCTHDTVLRFLPPYIIKKAEINALLTDLEEVLVECGGPASL